LLGLAVALRVWSIRTLGQSFTATVQTQAGQSIVDTGPYRWIRHPSYLGVLLSFGATAILFRSAAMGALTACILLPIYFYRIRVEEGLLAGELGAAYQEYQGRSSRLVPGVW